MTTQIFYGVRDCAAILGVSQKTVRILCSSGRLPFIRAGRLIRINVNDLKALADPKKPEPKPEDQA